MVSIFLLVLLLLLILCGAPIGFTLILIPFFYILVTDAVPLVLIPSQMFNAIDSVPLTAIAFFMLTGELMTSATITDRLVSLSRALIGRMRGGLAQVNVLVSMFFAGMNGSVVADTATVGALVLPAMKKAGYPPAFSAAVTGVSSTIGGIIPPSIMMIVLANATEISVASLFAAGIIPGLLIGAVIMLINHFFAVKYNFERSDEHFSIRRAGSELYRSSFALLIPVVLVGSVMGGVASVVEAGAITAMVALFTGVFVYRTIKWKECSGAFRRAFRNSAMVFIIIAASGPFSWLLTSLGAISDLENWLLSLTGSPITFILALIFFIFLLGTVMDSAVNIIIVGPVLVDVMSKAGFPEVQAAVVVIVGFLIGSVTPPVGVAFFTAATIAKVRLEEVAVALIPYLVGLFLLLFFIIVIPELTMFLPEMMSE
jgi:tripartite ATP-independent transporter DctM subunit|tara:strand:+ start:3185 stop:4468 length:1284 start_codon:yes stop_codon:yes gene_type:complete